MTCTSEEQKQERGQFEAMPFGGKVELRGAHMDEMDELGLDMYLGTAIHLPALIRYLPK